MAVLGTGFVWEPGVLDSVDPGELQSPDPDAVPLAVPVSARDALACAGSDDVRCQPLHESDAPTAPRVGSAGPDLTLAPPQPAPRRRTLVTDESFGRTALLGVGRDPTAELLRPPRA